MVISEKAWTLKTFDANGFHISYLVDVQGGCTFAVDKILVMCSDVALEEEKEIDGGRGVKSLAFCVYVSGCVFLCVCKSIIADVIFSNYTLLQSKQWEKAMKVDPGRIQMVGFDFAGKGASVF